MKTILQNQNRYIGKGLILIIFLLVCVKSFAGIVPDKVQAAFDKRFPGVLEINWERQHPNGYQAEFIFKGKTTKSQFSFEGIWMETVTEISTLEFPASVLETLTSFYPDWKIVLAGKVENSKQEIHYKAAIQMELKLQEIILKEEGTLFIVGLE